MTGIPFGQLVRCVSCVVEGRALDRAPEGPWFIEPIHFESLSEDNLLRERIRRQDVPLEKHLESIGVGCIRRYDSFLDLDPSVTLFSKEQMSLRVTVV